ncbi:MAG TPA: hypothetical protein VNY27_11390 [Solirubrobacteraceae bacterium]|jgi:hypothetical protein|nr:hypothetical protein [Solirubrobacteraceae bacterium]
MSPGSTRSPRSRQCDAADARKRLGDAEKYLEVAELVATEDSLESHNVATGLAVLAGIAAADAACCKTLGESSRGPDHHDAAAFLRRIAPGGETAAKHFERLVDLKDKAHYSFLNVSGQDRTGAIRRAGRLVDFAREALQR